MDNDNTSMIEQYRAGLDNLAEYGTRRLTTIAIFVGFNTIALTGLGVLIASATFDTWQVAIEASIIAVAITPVNILWIMALIQYKRGLNLRYSFLQRLEQLLFAQGDGMVSILHKVGRNGKYRHRHTSIEVALAIYFLLLFLLAAAIVAAITYYVQSGSLPIQVLIR